MMLRSTSGNPRDALAYVRTFCTLVAMSLGPHDALAEMPAGRRVRRLQRA
jgi:hypothetical protein